MFSVSTNSYPKMSESEYKELDQLEHMLRYPERDLGDCSNSKYQRYIYNPQTNRLELKEFIYNSAVEHLFLEILYNAADNCQTSRESNIDPGKIWITMDHTTISIKNQGRPISCQLQPGKQIHIPTFIFGQLLTSSRYGEGKSRKVGGRFGIGCKATNVFSTYFRIDIVNTHEKVAFSQTWHNNMQVRDPPIIKTLSASYTGTSSTTVTFTIDFSRFFDRDEQYGWSGVRQYNIDYMLAYMKFAIDISLTANIKTHFNRYEFDCTGDDGLLKYARYYFPNLNNHIIMSSADSLCMLVDTPDNGRCISFVNDVINNSGGVHVETWKKACLKDHLKVLKSKHKCKVKLNDLCNHISMILLCRLVNPEFDGQTKDKVTKPKPQVCLDVMARCSAISEWQGYKRYEEILKGINASIAKKSDGSKSKYADVDNLQDADYAGDPHKSITCTLYVTEGKSAHNFAIKCIESRHTTGALALKGKLLNVGNCKNEKYGNNAEVTQIKQALGLRENFDYSQSNALLSLRYGRLVILTDQDDDGMHIRGLIYNFFRCKFPALLTHHKYVFIMETPLLRVQYNRQIVPFFYEHDYIKWKLDITLTPEERQNRERSIVQYYKGLASSTDDELMEAYKIAISCNKIYALEYDNSADSMMKMAFDEEYSDTRKKWILSWNTRLYTSTIEGKFPLGSLSRFIAGPLCGFSYANVHRTIPSVIDGLKESQRKIMAVMLSLPKSSKLKVSQLKGDIDKKMHYRHGEESLTRTIIGMANDSVGTNNIAYIQALGQFDSRLGKCAGQARYINVSPHVLMPYIFRSEDECILEYMKDGDDTIEPRCYYPILPMFAINGTCGIGTGFSTDIPSYNPNDIIRYINWWICTFKEGGKVDKPDLKPWYRNYQGKIERINGRWYSIGDYKEIPSRKRYKDIIVTELPVTQTIESYSTMLKKLKEKPIMDPTLYEQQLSEQKLKKKKCPTYISQFRPGTERLILKMGGRKHIELLPRITIEEPIGIYKDGSKPIVSLRLIEKISDTNIVLLDNKDIPKIFDNSIYYAIDTYCQHRYDAYVNRRNKKMKEWKDLIDHHLLRIKFIELVNDGLILMKDRSKQDIISDLEKYNMPSSFLKMPIHSLSPDGIHHIKGEIDRIQIKLDDYQKLSAGKIWIRELGELFDKCKKYYG